MRQTLTIMLMGISLLSVLADDSLRGFTPTEELVGKCDRPSYGRWNDMDNDGEDTRQEVLIAESLVPVKRDSNGKVSGGLWIGLYTGTVTRSPGELEIDHMVPICEADESGGRVWPDEKRKQYFNWLEDNHHLIAVRSSANASKGKRDPAEWMPPNRAYWCKYLQDWVAIKRKWGLSIDREEYRAIEKGSAVCGRYEMRDRIDGLH